MPWNLELIAERSPPSKRDHFQSLFIRANLLGALPSTEKKAILVDRNDLEAVLFKAFEETFVSLDVSYFETRFNRFLKTCGDAPSFRIYFPGVNLHILNGESNLYVAQFRVPQRTNYDWTANYNHGA